MHDNQLIALLIATITAGEAVAGIPGTPVAAAFQNTRQGVNSKPTAYIHKVGDRRYGTRRVSDTWDQARGLMIHAETQQYETTFQVSALATQNPATPMQLTASDILNLIAYILQSTTAIAALQAQGVGLERVTEVRNPYFLDDRDQNEACPSFDLTVTHKQVVSSAVPTLSATTLQVVGV